MAGDQQRENKPLCVTSPKQAQDLAPEGWERRDWHPCCAQHRFLCLHLCTRRAMVGHTGANCHHAWCTWCQKQLWPGSSDMSLDTGQRGSAPALPAPAQAGCHLPPMEEDWQPSLKSIKLLTVSCSAEPPPAAVWFASHYGSCGLFHPMLGSVCGGSTVWDGLMALPVGRSCQSRSEVVKPQSQRGCPAARCFCWCEIKDSSKT